MSPLVPIILSAMVISFMGGALSIFVVLKRLAFIGQGISHAAFGGVGIAILLGVHGATTAGVIGQLLIVVAFSILAALWIAALSRSHKGRTDTAIGVVLSASMALGFVLFTLAESGHAHDEAGDAAKGHEHEHHVIEEILFGNIMDTGWSKATIAIVVSALIVSWVWCIRRKLIFWAFDEPVADAYGLHSKQITNLFLSILAIAVVMSMQIAGVVLASAMLVLPGAAALNLTARLRPAFIYSIAIALGGSWIGMFIALRYDYPIGPTIVLTQSIMYLITLAIKTIAIRS